MEARLSNGNALARLVGILLIFLTNYFANSEFLTSFYGMDFQQATSSGRVFLDVLNKSPFLIDKVIFVLSYAGWSGVVCMFIISGFSLWSGIKQKAEFEAQRWWASRIRGIYLPYLIAAVVSCVLAWLDGLDFQGRELIALMMGGAKLYGAAERINTPYWFITHLFYYYLLFPGIVLVYVRWRVAGLFGLLGFGAILHKVSALRPLLLLTGDNWFGTSILIGVLVAELLYRPSVQSFAKTRIRTITVLCIFGLATAIVGICYLVYLAPASRVDRPWAILHPYWMGALEMLACFSLGAILPTGWNRSLRFLARGTFAVFCYHYALKPFLMPYLKAEWFAGSISLALLGSYLILLIIGSYYQDLVDRRVCPWLLQWIRSPIPLREAANAGTSRQHALLIG